MTKINEKNPVSGLENEYKVLKKDYYQENDRLLQGFIDQEKSDKILEIIQNKDFTTSQLEKLISEIKTKEFESELKKYLDILKQTEKMLISYLIEKGLIDNNINGQTVKIAFKGIDFEGLDKNIIFFLENYLINNKSFENEIKKVNDNDSFYTINIVIEKKGDTFIKKDIYIEKMD